VLLAVAVTLATPEALVATVVSERYALAPDAGAAKVTIALLTGFPAESLTVTCSGFGKPVITDAVCGMAPVAVILAGDVDVLPSEKVAVKVAVKPSKDPTTLAVTV
jgi:hypothetical protein